jgi:hypothetical protein
VKWLNTLGTSKKKKLKKTNTKKIPKKEKFQKKQKFQKNKQTKIFKKINATSDS